MPRRIGRRRFLQTSAAAAVAGVAHGANIRLPDVGPRGSTLPEQPVPRVLTKELRPDTADLGAGSLSGISSSARGLELGTGVGTGSYVSPALRSDLTFDYAGIYWSGDYPPGSAVSFELRTSADGEGWSPWQTVDVDLPPGPLAEFDTYGALIPAGFARYVQFRAQLQGDGAAPAVKRVGLTLLNTRDGPPLETAREEGRTSGATLAAGADAATMAALPPKPVTFSREAWGADESLRFSGGSEVWPRSYVPVKKLVVHHTVTGNGYANVEEAKAQVRAIYVYHAISQGWGDIGYNCLVDRFGNSYEGRRGRDGPGYDGPGGREIFSEDAVAGHALIYNRGSAGIALLGTFCSSGECSGGASPSAAMTARLEDVLHWTCARYGIHPQGATHFLLSDGSWHYGLPNLVGHRDVGETTCPGGHVYSRLGQFRDNIAARMADPGGPVVFLGAAPPEATVSSGVVDYAWSGGGSGPFEYSYFFEGWSRNPNTGEVEYIRGFNGQKAPDWSAWSPATSVRLCYVAPGLYTFHVRVRDSAGRIGVYHDTRTFLGMSPSAICDGALVKGSGPAVYVVRTGIKRHIPNIFTFAAQRFLWSDINTIPNASLTAIPTGRPLLDVLADGNLLRGDGPAVYAMHSGARRHVTSPAVLDSCQYGWDAVQVIGGLVDAIPTGAPVYGPPCPHVSPPDGALVKGSGDEVYVAQAGLKRHITNPVTFFGRGFLWGNIDTVPNSVLNTVPTGQPYLDSLAEGNLLKGSEPAVYVMQSGARRHVTSPAVMDACDYGWDALQLVPSWLLSSVPTAAPLSGPPCPQFMPPEGSLVRGTGPAVYVVEKEEKRHVKDLDAFHGCGYHWGNVNIIPDSALGSIPTGDDITETTCP